MNEILYSVKDVAALIAGGRAEGHARLMRQVRHWTAHDLIVPVTGKHTGTGVSRMYDDHGVRCAAILYELSRYGMPLIQLECFAEWTESLVGSEDWDFAISGERDVFIAMAWERDEDGAGGWSIGIDEPGINILRTPKARGRRGLSGKPMMEEYHCDFASSVIINITKIFSYLAL